MPEQNHDFNSTNSGFSIANFIKSEKNFILLIGLLFIVAAALTPYPNIAMWFGFAMAGYSAVANDSIQTIGTFIVSNEHRKWWLLWLYIGFIFLATVTYSFVVFNGDVSYQRLQTPGLDVAPDSFTFLQLAAPIFLILLTRMRMPVSTTFLLLTIFSTKSSAVLSVLTKSVSGYFVAFVVAIIVWLSVGKFMKAKFKGKPHFAWTIIQWLTSGTLWSVWVMQDAANIAVFLPRELSLAQFIVFALFIFIGLGVLFYMKGDRIQKIVSEKSGIADIRAATVVDFVYAVILIYFKEISSIPMSTTWVFLGLLGGRELAISIQHKIESDKRKPETTALLMIAKDILMASIGLLISLIIAISINENMRNDFLNLF